MLWQLITSRMKSQLITYLLRESQHISWILDLESEVHSVWDLWINNLHECKGNFFLKKKWLGSQNYEI